MLRSAPRCNCCNAPRRPAAALPSRTAPASRHRAGPRPIPPRLTPRRALLAPPRARPFPAGSPGRAACGPVILLSSHRAGEGAPAPGGASNARHGAIAGAHTRPRHPPPPRTCQPLITITPSPSPPRSSGGWRARPPACADRTRLAVRVCAHAAAAHVSGAVAPARQPRGAPPPRHRSVHIPN